MNLTVTMKRKLFCWVLICLPFAGISQGVKKTSFYNNQVEISLPVEFEKGGDPPEQNRLYFPDKERSFKFSIVLSDDEVSDNDIPGYTDLAITAVKRESSSAKIYDDGISLNAGKNIGYIKYNSSETLSLFEYVFYGSLHDKLLTFYFSCKAEDRSKWEKKIDAIVSSLRINDKVIQ
ncbi:hypothetical protein [Ferruginibacter sp. HRS2-29]|uniref:hypothetical protein n=1 Tax=Ferruginibacter sp. HRS2-29 TaxID=2487334 RepID=UPI0020CCAB39|nr:hypothetical protein [Ferruginibacter sp. HRS2-29]MCP9752885.1 hypothetical protein [Ferruginibacter sp. HRS2-29]